MGHLACIKNKATNLRFNLSGTSGWHKKSGYKLEIRPEWDLWLASKIRLQTWDSTRVGPLAGITNQATNLRFKYSGTSDLHKKIRLQTSDSTWVGPLACIKNQATNLKFNLNGTSGFYKKSGYKLEIQPEWDLWLAYKTRLETWDSTRVGPLACIKIRLQTWNST